METTATVRQFSKRIKQAARCSRSQAQQVKKRTAAIHTDAFLTHTFLPFWAVASRDWKQEEREFKNSLSNLCRLYGWQEPDMITLPYPENIHSAFQQLKEKFKATQLDCIIAQDRQRKAVLATVKTFHVGMTLFYIPIRPVWAMMQDNADHLICEILFCIFSYLYNITGIPYFGSSGYLHNTYGYLQDMLEEEDGEEDDFRKMQQEELALLRQAGTSLLHHISKPFRKAKLEKLVKQYVSDDAKDTGAAAVVYDFFSFSNDYPNRSFYQDRGSSILFPQGTEYISPDQYLSFYWSSEDCFEDTLIEWVNADLQEMCEMDEPISLQWFDTAQQKEQHHFDYETRLFSLLDRLIELLNIIDHEKYQPPIR